MPHTSNGGKLRTALVLSLCWGIAWFIMSIAPFFSDAGDMASASAYHDLRELLPSQTPQSGTENETMAFFDRQWAALNRTRACLLLVGCSVAGLRRLPMNGTEAHRSLRSKSL